ncbi:MAG: L,D-transpeptidase family protein [Solirubrobacteraceae bacterium]
MPPRLTTLIAIVAVVLVGIAALFAWDASRADVIAAGVTVGAIDLSGLTRNQARARLQDRMLKPLSAPLVITVQDRTFGLTAREAQIHANVDAMVSDAIERSRAGGVLARTWREISGQEVDARVAPDIRYSRAAVQRLVDRVRTAVSRDAVDAKLDFAPDSVSIRPARTGRTIDASLLRAEVQTALVSARQDRLLSVALETVQPKVTADQLSKNYPVVLAIDRGHFRLSLFKQLKRVKVYPIAVGQVGLETPAGLYKIQNKAVDPAWHVPNSDWAGRLAGKVIPGGAPDNPIKARWLGVYDGVGVHGTDARGSIGTNASHGCIRMLIEDVEALYDEVPVGTPIYIH